MRGLRDWRYSPCVHLLCVCLAGIRSHSKRRVDLLIQFIPLSVTTTSIMAFQELWGRSCDLHSTASLNMLFLSVGSRLSPLAVLHIRRGSERRLTILSRPIYKLCLMCALCVHAPAHLDNMHSEWSVWRTFFSLPSHKSSWCTHSVVGPVLTAGRERRVLCTSHCLWCLVHSSLGLNTLPLARPPCLGSLPFLCFWLW